MKKSGVKEKHLAILADVYKEVIFNSHKRKKEDDKIELAGSFIGAKSAGAGEKGVRVSLFAATLGISPLLFMREVSKVSRYCSTAAGARKAEFELV